MTQAEAERITADMNDRLFARIAHGDPEHRAWLQSALKQFFEEEAKRLSQPHAQT